VFYINGNASPAAFISPTVNEDGLSYVTGGSVFTMDPTYPTQYFQIPMSLYGQDVQVVLYSDEAGQPWNLLRMEIKTEVDRSTFPRKNG
jgi:hypothetical protein